MPQPGWYPSPRDPETLSFWDGARWTGQELPSQAASEVPVSLSPEAASEIAGQASASWDDEELPDDLVVLPVPMEDMQPVEQPQSVDEPVLLDDEDDAFLLAEPVQTRRQRSPRRQKATSESVTETATETATEPAAEPARQSAVEDEDVLTASRRIRGAGMRRPALVSVPERPVRVPKPKARLKDVPGFRGALIGAVAGLALIGGGLFGVPAVLDPEPAGGPVAAGEVRSSAVVREVSMDGEGFCWPTVEVSTGLGSGEARALKLRELNTACPVKVDEVVTVYYDPQAADAPARYVADGDVPVDPIMWSVVGLGGLVLLWSGLRFWGGKSGHRIRFVTAR